MGVQPITVPQSLAYVLNTAGDKSNVDFGYLLNTAVRESSLNPEAKAPSSSAVGLFQFLDTTWLQVMKEEGPRLGYQQYADAITKDLNGDYVIKDKKLRAEVLNLREDPQVAADMAAAFTQSNGDYLKAKFGRMPSPGELYIAHFLGPQGAEKLFNAGLDNPDQVAAKLFPRQAKANPQIFYDGKHPRTIREVYKALVAKHDGIVAAPLPGADPNFVAQQLASAPGAPPPADPPSRFTPADMSFNALFATRPLPAPAPLIGTEAAAPLVAAQTVQPIEAINAAAGPAKSLLDLPLPAPDPLVPPSVAPLALMADEVAPTGPAAVPAPVAPAVPDGPQARILISPGVQPNSAFFVQLTWRQGGGP